jgi:hypothetical protein
VKDEGGRSCLTLAFFFFPKCLFSLTVSAQTLEAQTVSPKLIKTVIGDGTFLRTTCILHLYLPCPRFKKEKKIRRKRLHVCTCTLVMCDGQNKTGYFDPKVSPKTAFLSETLRRLKWRNADTIYSEQSLSHTTLMQ